eukprot:UN12950
MQEQRSLEGELEKLNTAQDQEVRAKEIKQKVINSGDDPMLSDENPFHLAGPDCKCTIL